MRDMQATFTSILNTLGQGLFLFEADGICSSTFSKACLTLIERSPARQHIADILGVHESERDTLLSLIKLLFSNSPSIASHDDLLELFPKEFQHSKGLLIRLDYRPIKNDLGQLQAVLVMAIDRTKEIQAQQLGQEREQHVLTVLRISSNRNIFTQFYLSATAYFSSLEECLPTTSLEQIRRDVHTLKGNASIFHLHKFVGTLHDLETQLADVVTTEHIQEVLLPAIPIIQDLLEEIKTEARNVLGDAFDQQGAIRYIPLDQLKGFADSLGTTEEAAALKAEFISSFMGEPIHKQLAPLAMGLQELADRYGKNISPCEFTGENFPILSERHQALFNSFAHIIRNIVAHAVEEDEARANYGKPVSLSVVIDTHKFNKDSQEWLRIIFTDDGAGIDVEKLRQKLNLLDTDATSDAEVMQHIFDDNLSTKEMTDELSGRGAGMGAIKERAQSLGGIVYVESAQYIFTRIVIEIPHTWDM